MRWHARCSLVSNVRDGPGVAKRNGEEVSKASSEPERLKRSLARQRLV